MVWSIMKVVRSKLIKQATAAALAVGAAFSGAPVAAQVVEDGVAPDWYIFAGRNAADNPIIVYFQSDSSSPEFQPTGSVAMILNPEFDFSGEFNPFEACMATSLEFEPENAKALRTRIIYGPNSEQKTVSIVDFPSYMAKQTAITLLQEGIVIDEKATAPYFSCAGFVWAALSSQPQETWEEIIKREIESQKAEK